MTQHLVPLLNDLAISVAAPAIVLSDPDGQIRPGGVRGWFVDDVRVLSGLTVSVAGSGLDLVRAQVSGSGRQEFTYVARELGGWLHDPQVTVDRRRTLTGSVLEEEVEVASRAQQPVHLVLTVDLASDLAPMAQVRQGHDTTLVTPAHTAGGLRWDGEPHGVDLTCEPAPTDGSEGRLTWRTTVEPGTSYAVRLRFGADGRPQFAPGGAPPWGDGIRVEAPDRRLGRLVEQSLADLGGLLLRDGDDAFLAAGSPWFLTLFGRDSLWAARLLMPFGTGLALSTLRTLARRQGTKDDPAAEEQPGKILHEVRTTTLELGGMSLPPTYYGSVDATALFVCTLADAWQWGADRDEVAALLPVVRRCLEWVLAESAETGWLRYVDTTGRGLANQGWKDSVDSVQFADGRLADPPIALSEVQGYAHEAAVRGAALLAAFGEEPVPGLAEWAEGLRERFRRDFWVDTPDGGHVAIALDRDGVAVDSATSNMGHLLGTGILSEAQVARVVEVLGGPGLSSGFGLRTLTSASPRYSRLSYHGGSVWPHDTAVAVRGLAREGYVAEAAALAAGVVRASEGQRPTAYRLPELYGGDAGDDATYPVDYPAACRPQAWAAAAPLACLVAATGLDVDVPAGRTVHPVAAGTALGAFTLHGIRAGEDVLTVSVDAEGRVALG
ncbi:MAG: amylo-alpha-1,6-glucosidase [Nocardioidaceae bacterium]|nr:amylo-alpha-1,6-glucosidase [Nocardioidaceae bacterium]NUS50021.1 amylo-alpha-1,6-glucosidase [Nocardioidaceae bacterium]